jgi:hypothetical protein
MQQFILARGQKPNAFEGVKMVEASGNMPRLAKKIEFAFRPGKIVEVPDDVDMSGWVDGGYIIPVRPGKPMAKEPIPSSPEPVPPKPEPPKEVSVTTQPKPKVEMPPAARPKVEAPPVPPKPEPPKEEPKPDYEELEDGSFKCLHCDKTYKANSRAEEYVRKHVEKEHL